ncbi:MAG: YdcF family protein [Candidatus Saccharimonadales bacterium]
MMRFLAVVIGIALTIVLVGAYLGPDDLARCSSTPNAEPGLAQCQKADAIVAVSGGDTTARTQEAVDLYQRGWADTLVFSGAAADKEGPSNAAAMRQYAIDHGVPVEAIIIEEFSETTKENAALTNTVFADRDFRRVILVTSAYHQRRANLEFRNSVGSDVVVVNHPVSRDNQWSQWWWLTPSGWWLAGSEIVKILVVYMGISR